MPRRKENRRGAISAQASAEAFARSKAPRFTYEQMLKGELRDIKRLLGYMLNTCADLQSQLELAGTSALPMGGLGGPQIAQYGQQLTEHIAKLELLRDLPIRLKADLEVKDVPGMEPLVREGG